MNEPIIWGLKQWLRQGLRLLQGTGATAIGYQPVDALPPHNT